MKKSGGIGSDGRLDGIHYQDIQLFFIKSFHLCQHLNLQFLFSSYGVVSMCFAAAIWWGGQSDE